MFGSALYDPLRPSWDPYGPLGSPMPAIGPYGIPIYGPVACTGLPAAGATRMDGTPYYNPIGQPIDRWGNLCDGGALSGHLW